jgi:hypothetical protein
MPRFGSPIAGATVRATAINVWNHRHPVSSSLLHDLRRAS